MFIYSQNKQKSYVPCDNRSDRPLTAELIIMKKVESLRITPNILKIELYFFYLIPVDFKILRVLGST